MRGDPLKRAKTAYLRALVRHGELHPPPITTAGIVEYHDQIYVILRTPDTLLAMYQVLKRNGRLKRVHRWPAALEEGGDHCCSR